jgi:hypothetical protein
LKKIAQGVFLLFVLFSLSGCIAVSVVSAAVGVTTTIIGGAVDVVDAVTPDIFDDDGKQEEEEEDDNDNDKSPKQTPTTS